MITTRPTSVSFRRATQCSSSFPRLPPLPSSIFILSSFQSSSSSFSSSPSHSLYYHCTHHDSSLTNTPNHPCRNFHSSPSPSAPNSPLNRWKKWTKSDREEEKKDGNREKEKRNEVAEGMKSGERTQGDESQKVSTQQPPQQRSSSFSTSGAASSSTSSTSIPQQGANPSLNLWRRVTRVKSEGAKPLQEEVVGIEKKKNAVNHPHHHSTSQSQSRSQPRHARIRMTEQLNSQRGNGRWGVRRERGSSYRPRKRDLNREHDEEEDDALLRLRNAEIKRGWGLELEEEFQEREEREGGGGETKGLTKRQRLQEKEQQKRIMQEEYSKMLDEINLEKIGINEIRGIDIKVLLAKVVGMVGGGGGGCISVLDDRMKMIEICKYFGESCWAFDDASSSSSSSSPTTTDTTPLDPDAIEEEYYWKLSEVFLVDLSKRRWGFEGLTEWAMRTLRCGFEEKVIGVWDRVVDERRKMGGRYKKDENENGGMRIRKEEDQEPSTSPSFSGRWWQAPLVPDIHASLFFTMVIWSHACLYSRQQPSSPSPTTLSSSPSPSSPSSTQSPFDSQPRSLRPIISKLLSQTWVQPLSSTPLKPFPNNFTTIRFGIERIEPLLESVIATANIDGNSKVDLDRALEAEANREAEDEEIGKRRELARKLASQIDFCQIGWPDLREWNSRIINQLRSFVKTTVPDLSDQVKPVTISSQPGKRKRIAFSPSSCSPRMAPRPFKEWSSLFKAYADACDPASPVRWIDLTFKLKDVLEARTSRGFPLTKLTLVPTVGGILPGTTFSHSLLEAVFQNLSYSRQNLNSKSSSSSSNDDAERDEFLKMVLGFGGRVGATKRWGFWHSGLEGLINGLSEGQGVKDVEKFEKFLDDGLRVMEDGLGYRQDPDDFCYGMKIACLLNHFRKTGSLKSKEKALKDLDSLVLSKNKKDFEDNYDRKDNNNDGLSERGKPQLNFCQIRIISINTGLVETIQDHHLARLKKSLEVFQREIVKSLLRVNLYNQAVEFLSKVGRMGLRGGVKSSKGYEEVFEYLLAWSIGSKDSSLGEEKENNVGEKAEEVLNQMQRLGFQRSQNIYSLALGAIGVPSLNPTELKPKQDQNAPVEKIRRDHYQRFLSALKMMHRNRIKLDDSIWIETMRCLLETSLSPYFSIGKVEALKEVESWVKALFALKGKDDEDLKEMGLQVGPRVWAFIIESYLRACSPFSSSSNTPSYNNLGAPSFDSAPISTNNALSLPERNECFSKAMVLRSFASNDVRFEPNDYLNLIDAVVKSAHPRSLDVAMELLEEFWYRHRVVFENETRNVSIDGGMLSLASLKRASTSSPSSLDVQIEGVEEDGSSDLELEPEASTFSTSSPSSSSSTPAQLRQDSRLPTGMVVSIYLFVNNLRHSFRKGNRLDLVNKRKGFHFWSS